MIKIYKDSFKKNGFVLMKNILSIKQKNILERYVNEIENTSLNNKNNYIHKYETDKNNNKVLCRTEYIIDNHHGMNTFLTQGILPTLWGCSKFC